MIQLKLHQFTDYLNTLVFMKCLYYICKLTNAKEIILSKTLSDEVQGGIRNYLTVYHSVNESNCSINYILYCESLTHTPTD